MRYFKAFLWIIALAVLIPASASAVPAKLTDSYIVWPATHAADYVEVQFFRIDNSASIIGTGPNGGEEGETGDWSTAYDARGRTTMSLYVFEYGGTAEVTVWDCIAALRPGTAADITVPGAVDPATTGGGDESDPQCLDITAAANVTILGTAAGIRKFSLSERMFNHIIVRLEACSVGTCDLMAWALFGK